MKKLILILLLLFASCSSGSMETSGVIIYKIGTNENGEDMCVQSTNGTLSQPFICPKSVVASN